jgi:hypothetical protein
MRKLLIIGFFSLTSSLGLFFCGLHELSQGISEAKMVEALQQALVLGSKTAANNLGDSSCTTRQCVTGYLGNELVEILVPDTIQNVLNKINSFTTSLNSLSPTAKPLLQTALGSSQYNSIFNLGKYGDSIKTALNRGAEKAAPKSVDVFKGAIFDMSFSNAKSILMGADTEAATNYLHNATYTGLKSAFAPIIKEPLDLLNPNKFWEPVVSNYNSFASSYLNVKNNLSSNLLLSNALSSTNSSLPGLPYDDLPEDISDYLSTYATGKALDGLFLMVGKQESKLRADPLGAVREVGGFISDAVGDLLVDVFGKAKDNLL